MAGLSLIAATGVAGDLAYAAASQSGGLSIVSAISSLYPLTTIALGVVLQHRRTDRIQNTGILLALMGAVVLASATH